MTENSEFLNRLAHLNRAARHTVSPALSLPPPAPYSAAISPGAGATEQLNLIERAYDSIGLMRGNEYVPVVRGLFTGALVFTVVALAKPDWVFDEQHKPTLGALALTATGYFIGSCLI